MMKKINISLYYNLLDTFNISHVRKHNEGIYFIYDIYVMFIYFIQRNNRGFVYINGYIEINIYLYNINTISLFHYINKTFR